MMADYELIQWLIFDSGVSNYKISKETGVTEQLLGHYKNGKKDIRNMTLDTAIKLTEYALQIKEK